MSRRCLVLGATGLIGSHVAAAMAARGWVVRGLARSWVAHGDAWGTAPIPPDEMERVTEDLGQGPRCDPWLEGVDVVIHAAALSDDWGHYGFGRTVHRAAQSHLFGSIARSAARRLVLISAATVHGPGASGVVTENHPLVRSGELCGDTKCDAEELARGLAGPRGLEVTIVRPATCYGPGDRHFLPRVIRDLERHRCALIGGGRTPANLCHARSVADLVGVCAEHPGAAGQAYLVRDRELLSWREALTLIAERRGLPAPHLTIPASLARPAARVMSAVASWLATTHPPPLTPHAVDILTSKATFSLEKARNDLGSEPRFTTREGLTASVPPP